MCSCSAEYLERVNNGPSQDKEKENYTRDKIVIDQKHDGRTLKVRAISANIIY